MAEIPQMPPGVMNAVQSGAPVQASDISGGGSGGGGGALPASGAPIDASTLLNPSLTQLRSDVQQSASDLANSRSTSLTGQAQVQAGAQQQAQGQQGLNMADFMTRLQQQQRDAKVYAMWGTTPGAPSATVAAVADRIMSHEKDIQADRDALNDKMKQGFWDNPIQWLSNQITMPFDEQTLNNEIAGRNDDLEFLHQLAIRTQEGVAADAAAAYAITTPRLAALDTLAAGAAQVKAGESQMQLAGVLTGVAQIGDKIATTPYTALAEGLKVSTEIDQEQYMKVIQVQTNARNAEMEKVQYDIAHVNDVDMNKKLAASKDLDERVRKIGAVTGTNIQYFSQLQQMAEGKEKQAIMNLLWNPDIQQGQALSLIGPAEAIGFANTVRFPLSVGQDLLRQKLTQYEAATMKILGPTAKTLYTPEQLLIKVNDDIKGKVRDELKDIPSTGGMYSPPSLLTTLSLPGIAQQAPKLSAALSPLANPAANTDKNYPTDARDVTSAATNLIKTGRATPAEMATEISNFYTTIMQNQDLTKGFRLFALPSIGDSGTFHAAVPSEGPFTSVAVHNLANKAEMESYLTRMIIKMQLAPGVPSPVMTAPSNLPVQQQPGVQ